MKVSVITVMHTGTHLLRYCVLRAYYQPDKTENPLFDGDSSNQMYTAHLDQPIDYEKCKSEGPIFSSLRHPARAAYSFLGRKRPMAEFYKQWDRLLNELHPYVDAYVHVDSIPNRDRQVLEIGNILGIDLSCAWDLEGHSGSRLGNHNIHINDCPEVPGEYIDFYYETLLKAGYAHD